MLRAIIYVVCSVMAHMDGQMGPGRLGPADDWKWRCLGPVDDWDMWTTGTCGRLGPADDSVMRMIETLANQGPKQLGTLDN